MWGCVTGTSVFFSKYWTAYSQHSGVTSQGWSYLRRKPRGRGKQGVRNDSFRGKRHNLFVCLFCLCFLKCCFFGLNKLLNFWTSVFNLPVVIIPRDPLPSWHIIVTENSIASERSSLKLLSLEFLLGFSYIAVVDNISSILCSLEVGLISSPGSKPQTSSHFLGLCEMASLTTWVIPLLN